MGERLLTVVKQQQRKQRRKRVEHTPDERLALAAIRSEAKKAGATLSNGGKGGLSPELVLRVFRRDQYRCKVHGDAGEGDCGGLQVHHKGGITESAWLTRKAHKNVANNLVTLCAKAHDEIHTRADARAAEEQHGE